MSIIRDNLLTQAHYTPYCGNDNCGPMPRTRFINGQFKCPYCNWKSNFEPEFIAEYEAAQKILTEQKKN